MTEPDVTLTDYGLAIECALFAYLVHVNGSAGNRYRFWLVVFFGATGTASLLGGTVHGFFLDANTVGAAILWPASLIAIGGAALAAWGIAAALLCARPVAHWIVIVAGAEFAVYCLVILFVTDNFMFAIVNYLPPALALLLALIFLWRRTRERQPAIGAIGIGLMFVASWAQQQRFALHPVYFNHNALYHLAGAAALLLIFVAAKWLATTTAVEGV
jgi:hypothetical protein